jgi:hypothetical protein
MRLTLRTLLAYLDDLLDAGDGEQISAKIKESDFASNLVVRIRDSMRRLRLGVPSLKGRGMGVDPNTVAEYLDNTMPAERVPEFERVCLESDMHLAEVASCHQVVSLVLAGHPVEIEPASRQRMYALLTTARAEAEAAAHRETPLAGHPEPVGAAAAATARRKPEIPDYLREQDTPARGVWLRFAVAAALVLTVGGGILLYMNQNKTPLAQTGDESTPPADDGKQNPPDDKPAATDGAKNTSGPGATKTADAATDAATGVAAAAAGTATDAATADAVDPLHNPGADGPDRTSTPTAPVPGEPAEEPAPPVTPEGAVTDTTVDGKMPAAGATETTEPGTTATAAGDVAAADAATTPAGDAAGTPATPPSAPAAGAAAPAVGQAVGRLVSEQSLLLGYVEPQGWERVPASAAVTAGEKVLALPGFRPTVSLNSGVTLRLIGASQVTMLPPDAADVPGIAVDFGRIVVMNTGRAGSQIRFRIQDIDAKLTFGDPSAVAAIEVYPVTLTGNDPEGITPPLIGRLYAASGGVEWEDLSGGAKQSLDAPRVVDVITPPPGFPSPSGELPTWATGAEEPAQIEQLAADFVVKSLPPGQPARLALKEFAENRRIEVRALAARSLALLGDYEPLIEALNLESERPNWPQDVDALRFALALGPEHAALVRETFVKVRRDNSTELYRLLWGYTPAQLEMGEALKLVDRLDHPALDMRVLAFLNLRQIAGLDYGYRPEKTEISRQPSLRKWRQWAERIGPSSAPKP